MVPWTKFSPNSCSYIEALTPHVAVFGNRALEEIIKIKLNPKARPNIGFAVL